MKTTQYFDFIRSRPDRLFIKDEWIIYVIENPAYMQVQSDGRIRFWRQIMEFEGRYLRVVLLADSETVHNAFFDRRFKP